MLLSKRISGLQKFREFELNLPKLGCLKVSGVFGSKSLSAMTHGILDTLQGINISHLGKRKIIFKMPFLGDMLVPWRVPPPFAPPSSPFGVVVAIPRWPPGMETTAQNSSTESPKKDSHGIDIYNLPTFSWVIFMVNGGFYLEDHPN